MDVSRIPVCKDQRCYASSNALEVDDYFFYPRHFSSNFQRLAMEANAGTFGRASSHKDLYTCHFSFLRSQSCHSTYWRIFALWSSCSPRSHLFSKSIGYRRYGTSCRHIADAPSRGLCFSNANSRFYQFLCQNRRQLG